MRKAKRKFEGWPTTRCFPRRLEDAFPHDPQNAQWFFPPEKKRGALELTMLSVAFWVWVGLAYWFASSS